MKRSNSFYKIYTAADFPLPPAKPDSFFMGSVGPVLPDDVCYTDITFCLIGLLVVLYLYYKAEPQCSFEMSELGPRVDKNLAVANDLKQALNAPLNDTAALDSNLVPVVVETVTDILT